MRTRVLGTFVAGLAILGTAPCRTSAAALCVEPTGAGGCHMTIQAAVNAAVSGDTIDIAAATYSELFTIPAGTNNLAITAAGAIIDGTGLNGVALTILANGTTIEGLTLQNLPDEGIIVGDDLSIMPSGTTLRGVRILGTGEDCITLNGADTTLISGCTLASCGASAIASYEGPDSGGSNDLTIEKSVVTGASDICVYVEGNNPQIRSSKIDSCYGDCIAISGDNALVEGNKISACADTGINLGGNAAVIQKNKLRSTSDWAISVGGANPTVLKNKAFGVGGGIDVDSDPCSGGSVVGNKVSDTFESDSEGIKAECQNGSGSLLVEKNKVARSLGPCFALKGASITLNGNKATVCGGTADLAAYQIAASQSTITSNSAKGAAQHGFEILADDCAVSGNKSIGNYGSGFAVAEDVTGVVLTANSTSRNAGVGFAVFDAATAVTLAGNSSGDMVPYCKDQLSSTVTDGLGNSFSLATPPICPPNL